MLTVTERARGTLTSLLEEVDEPGLSLRLEVSTTGQLRLVADEERDGDLVIEHEGTPVLLVEEGLAAPLEGAILDCEETTKGTQLTITR